MSEDIDYIIETDEINTRNKFPIIAQLGILGVILLGLFGSLLWGKNDTEPVLTPETPVASAFVTQEPIVPEKLEEIEIFASSAYVWDVKGQRALYSKNADEQLPLASITKLMTTLLAYELVEENTEASVSLSAIMQEGSSGLVAGEKFEAEKLRELALISSSNDAAFALAASVGALLGDNDPTSQFVDGMNIRAKELGLESLQFWNTTGLDISTTKPGSVGSAKDVSFLMEYIITNHPEIISPTQKSTARIYNTEGAYHEISNTNEAVLDIPNMIGSKTGYTDLAGGNLTVAFDAGLNRPIIITVLGSSRNGRFTDVLTLVKAVQKSVGAQQ
ncbi:D-alanyl-D-alanine carboxypeptidase [Candidatus Kaiserbacteria bacterium]|nr:D-alanyl-D-alanine carboxypeptidase [Candidatus Kaiserbacteria bacterium]USN92029.1 MAG: D-alanyl-D-alanine carboxypeptidase [Candidatus Nomurabacteria bacterium]